MTMEHARKRSRVWRLAWAIPAAVLLAGIAFLAGNVATGRWSIHPVATGSMRPGFPIGSVVITQREPVSHLAPREVIITTPPGSRGYDLIHRVVSVTPAAGGPIVQTMGDNNAAPDPWKVQIRSKYIYQARFTLPLVGYAAMGLHSPEGRDTTLGVAGLLAATAVANAFRERRPLSRRRPVRVTIDLTGENGGSLLGLVEPKAF